MKIQTDDKGLVKDDVFGGNMYISFPLSLSTPLPFDIYAKAGIGEGSETTTYSVGIGVALDDLVQVEVKHTEFGNTNVKADTSVIFRINVPLVVLFWDF